MTPQEKDLITTLLARLKGVAGQPKDPEADALIRQDLAEQPDAPYYLVQTVLIQDLSLHNAQNRIDELERQLADAQATASKPTSFLGGLFGRSEPAPAPPASVPTAGPWTRSPQVAAAPPQQPGYAQPGYAGAPGYAQPMGGGGFLGSSMGGGGFLRSAAATAAGIAGGALLFEGISSMFGHQASAGILGGQAMTPGLGETVINNYYGSDAGGSDPGAAGQDFSGGDAGNADFASGQDFSSDQDFSGGGDAGGGDAGGGDFSGGDVSC